MQAGELTESVRNRSVYRQLHLDMTGERKYGCGELSDLVFSSAGPLPGYADKPWRQVTAAANSLAADGADGMAVSVQGCLPTSYEEARLREDMKQFAMEARENGMEICDANLQVSGQVNAPQYFVTAVGQEDHSGRLRRNDNCLRPGQELVVTRQIALAGTAALARKYEKELRQRYPFWLIDRARDFEQWMPAAEAAKAAYRCGAEAVFSAAQGGIFCSLWEMAERANVGLEVDLRKIPVSQETVEICEYFDINPYYLYSAGCLLIGTARAETLVDAFDEAGIPASVIGHVTDRNDRIIHNGENRRFLDRPKRDELWKLF